MSPFQQHTLATSVAFAGIGLHTGADVRAALHPAPADTGFVFVRTDIAGPGARVAATAEAVCATQLGTVIGQRGGVTVATIEHLMAAFAALGVDNAVVELNGPEVPIMDGSAQPFVQLIDEAGRRRQDAPRRYIEILDRIEAHEDDKNAVLSPAEGFEMAFEILFPTKAIGRQRVDLAIDEEAFRHELADCRTFGFLHEVEALRAIGLALGGSLDNAVVIDGETVMNPKGLRRPDEFVRHKALDAIGDLYLLGAPIIGRYEGLYAGHGLNNAVCRALLARPSAWRYISYREELDEAV